MYWNAQNTLSSVNLGLSFKKRADFILNPTKFKTWCSIDFFRLDV